MSNSNQSPGDVAIVEPPRVMRYLVQITALTVSHNGSEMEKMLMRHNEGTTDFSFLRSSDPFHAFYKHTLATYQTQRPADFPDIPKISTHEELYTLRLTMNLSGIIRKEGSSMPPESPEFRKELDDLRIRAQFVQITRNESHTTNVAAELRDSSPFRLCKTITRIESDTIKVTPQLSYSIIRKEIETIRLTAQFVARYGKDFLLALTKSGNIDSRFEFMNPGHSMFDYFSGRVAAYSNVLTHCEMLKSSTACAPTVIDVFFTFLQGEKVVGMPMINLNAGIDYFAFVESRESPLLLGLEGMTSKEIDIIKVTAQFVARYGMEFWLALKSSGRVDCQFEFMNSGASGFGCFNLLVAAYSEVLRPSDNLSDGTARAWTVVDGFFRRLGGFERVLEHSEGMDMDAVCLHGFICSVDIFAVLDSVDRCPWMPPPEYLSVMMTQRLSGMLEQPSMDMMQDSPMPGMSFKVE